MRIALVCAVVLGIACSNKEAPAGGAKKSTETAATTGTATDAHASPPAPAGAAPAPNAQMRTAPAEPAKHFLTSTSDARLHASASADAPEVAHLAIGTVVSTLGASPDAAWAQVATADGRKGWIATSELRELDTAHPEDTYLALAEAGNAKKDLSFAERTDLYFAITHAIQNSRDHATLAKLELARIIALKNALASGAQLQGDAAKPYTDFAKQLGSDVIFNDPPGTYDPNTERLWLSAKTFKDVPEGERIAWAAATTPLPGTCAHSFACNLRTINASAGRYLAAYPKGAHAALALAIYERAIAPTDTSYYEDDPTLQQTNDALKEADATLAGCDPQESKAAKATLAKNHAIITKMKAGKMPQRR